MMAHGGGGHGGGGARSPTAATEQAPAGLAKWDGILPSVGTVPSTASTSASLMLGKEKQQTYQPSHSNEVPLAELQRLQQQRIAPSYATTAYREFLAHSNNASAAQSRSHSRRSSLSSGGGMDSVFGSAASSAQSSAYSSVAPSGATTQQHSRATSPSATAGSERQSAAEAYAQAARDIAHTHASSFAEPLAYNASHPLQASQMAHLAPGQGQLSLTSLKPTRPEDEDSDGVDHSVRLPARALLRPRHFTFAEADVMKSLRRSQERERARAEREAEHAREAALHAAREQERERQRIQELQQYQREQAARELAYKMSLQRQELDRQRRLEHRAEASDSTVMDSEDSSESASPDSPPMPGERAHSPRPPSHFRFDTHDIRKSYSKPSQRQAIGHWTTFPRSGTVMYAAHQLKALVANRQQEIETKLQSAPTSPVHAHGHSASSAAHRHAVEPHGHHQRYSVGESTASLAWDLADRRASMPAASHSGSVSHSSSVAVAPLVHNTFLHAPVPSHSVQYALAAPHLAPLEARPVASASAASTHAARPRPSHSRSVTLGSVPLEKLRAHTAEIDKARDSTPSAFHKQYPAHGSGGFEQNSRIRRPERPAAHARGSSAGSLERTTAGLRFSDTNANAAASSRRTGHPVKAVPMHAPAQQLGTSTTVPAADVRARRTKQQSNSAPSSPRHFSHGGAAMRSRALEAAARFQTSGAVRGDLAAGRASSGGSSGALTGRPTPSALLHGSESKSASANSSPLLQQRARMAGSASTAGLLASGELTLPLLAHERTGEQAWTAQHAKTTASYQNMPAATAYALRR